MLDLLRLFLLSICLLTSITGWYALNIGMGRLFASDGGEFILDLVTTLSFSLLLCVSAYVAYILVYQLLGPF